MPGTRDQTILILRYAKGRLYDTNRRCYVLINQLRERVSLGAVIAIADFETGLDVTDLVLQ